MKRYFYSIATIISVSMFMLACSRVGSSDVDSLAAIDENDDVFPVIAVTRPSANQVYVSGDSIIVEGKVTDDKKMYNGKVQIKNDVNGFVLAESYYETHFLLAISFRLAYKAIVTAPTDFTALVEFQDHGANTSTATIKVKVNP